MTRREFHLFLAGAANAAAAPGSARPRIAITMDDFSWQSLPDAGQVNAALLQTFAKHSNLKIALFVIGQNADSARGKELLQAWNDAGHWICNHSYSHRAYSGSDETPATLSADVLRCEEVLRGYSGYRKFFRFPALREGETAVKRDRMRAFLEKHGYRNGHVTIDDSDWYYDRRLRARLPKDPHDYHDVYLEHLWQCAQYYDGMVVKAVRRTIPHTILLHYNLLNSLFLDDVLSMFEQKGWELISAEKAYQDPIFLRSPKTLPAGESLVWQLSKEATNTATQLRYPSEGADYEKAKLDRLGL